MEGEVTIETDFRALRGLATRLAQHGAIADDLAQDAWVDALRNPVSDGRPSASWLRVVLRNRRITNHRAEQRRRARETAAQLLPHTPPSAEQLQSARELVDHLAALSEADRDLLVLRYWHGMTLQECAERLELSASTARTRHARALHKLRQRLDARAGGREAWLAALAPWVQLPPPTPPVIASGMSLASISVGGVVASTLLWLVSALDPGCGFDATTATPQSEAAAHAKPPNPEGPAEPASLPPNVHRRASGEVDFDADKHPCDLPIAREDSPTMAAVSRSGRLPTRDEVLSAFVECAKLHGPARDYRALHEGKDGSVHPLLSATMALREVWPVMRHCNVGQEPAWARVAFSIWLREDGEMLVDDVRIVKSDGLDDAQLVCVVSSVYVAELGLRRGDPQQMDLPAGTVLEMPRLIEVELKNERVEVLGGGHRPPGVLVIAEQDRFDDGLRACTSDPIHAVLQWDPETGELLTTEANAAKTDAVSACIRDLLRSELQPLTSRFFPRTDADTEQTCTFEAGAKPQCDAEPLFQVSTD